ncbi:hypothetical protein GLOIN_2v1871772 [Rhizophagus clarus]|uniref:Uncharacterized protein n=1 Tax=Rhizophagus clarus TaxID=94130 RepID=A0A8H3LDE0_9GLOM|nr:hypothetical protein GLOIN_2v1871772 [Rhizophagus clarus]
MLVKSFLTTSKTTLDIQKNVPLRACGELRYPAEGHLELSKYWDVCPVLISYIQSLSKFTLKRALLRSWQMLEKASKLRQKAKAEREAAKALKSSHSSLDPLVKQFTPPKRDESTGNETLIQPPEKKAKSLDKPNTRKVVKNEASTVITGYQPALNSQAFVRDIIVYDIPAKWDNFTIINALFDWGKVISMTVKRQKKYKTLCVKLEISQLFRNYEKHWIAPLIGFPKDNEAYLISHNINMFKEVKLPDGKRKIIGYLSNWDDLYRLINTPNVWHGKTPGKTKNTNTFFPNDSAKTRSIKKVATSTNNIPLRNKRGAASQQQYSSSTKPGQDSPKADYDNKKSKSKSKRSSASKKMIIAEIT